eukprot:TRINITY_DN13000_c0_g1_i1.p2 TRINITY_DN13000_c0_g1~~TRINITY_DN13000_c0_g1_i1.p2  ORF type:complete len:154 (-),score=15.85 TRINITY_DN13000_c0_g1_i1:1081-1542(-)
MIISVTDYLSKMIIDDYQRLYRTTLQVLFAENPLGCQDALAGKCTADAADRYCVVVTACMEGLERNRIVSKIGSGKQGVFHALHAKFITILIAGNEWSSLLGVLEKDSGKEYVVDLFCDHSRIVLAETQEESDCHQNSLLHQPNAREFEIRNA